MIEAIIQVVIIQYVIVFTTIFISDGDAFKSKLMLVLSFLPLGFVPLCIIWVFRYFFVKSSYVNNDIGNRKITPFEKYYSNLN